MGLSGCAWIAASSAGLVRWTSVLLVFAEASKGAGVRLPEARGMVRVWMLGDWPWPTVATDVPGPSHQTRDAYRFTAC